MSARNPSGWLLGSSELKSRLIMRTSAFMGLECSGDRETQWMNLQILLELDLVAFFSSLQICFGRLAAQKITAWIGSLRFRFLRCGSLYWLFIFCMNTGYETRFWILFKGCGCDWIWNFHETHGFPRRKSEVVCRINFSEIALLDINDPCKRDLVDLIILQVSCWLV